MILPAPVPASKGDAANVLPSTVNEPDTFKLFTNVVHAALEVRFDPIINESLWTLQFSFPPNIPEHSPPKQLYLPPASTDHLPETVLFCPPTIKLQ